VVLTAATVALKFALLDPAGTVTETGTVTDELLLDRLTLSPLLPAGALSATMQLSVVDPVTAPLEQVNELKDPVAVVTPVPLRLTTMLLFEDESLVIVIWPEAGPVAEGLNCTLKVNVPFGLTVAGSWLWLCSENDCP
jgi:hypothetical protein